jgi:uncharacterized membrane protein YdbT with pleckstrin-like domain
VCAVAGDEDGGKTTVDEEEADEEGANEEGADEEEAEEEGANEEDVDEEEADREAEEEEAGEEEGDGTLISSIHSGRLQSLLSLRSPLSTLSSCE